MDSKKWCIISLLACVIVAAGIVVLNAVIDPFGVFGDEWYSYNETINPKIAKIEYLKKNHDKYDSYVIGCSSTSSYPVDELNHYLNAKFYNLIMYGADMLDVEETVDYLINNYEVKNIFLNTYISNGYSYDVESDKMTDSIHADVDKSSKFSFYSKFLFANPKYSKDKWEARRKDGFLPQTFDVFDEETGAYDKRLRDAEHISDMKSYLEKYPVFSNYPNHEYGLGKIKETCESLAKIKEKCRENGVRLICVNAPVYHDYFDGIIPSDLKQFYKEYANVCDFWDFSLSSISYDCRYFYDETHFRNDVGRMALARIFDDESIYIPENFGRLVTKENVDEYTKSLYEDDFMLKPDEYTKMLPILLYHNIDEVEKNDMTVTPELFSEHMYALKKAGYTAIDLNDVNSYIKEGRELPDNPILITFDDGYESNYHYAYPILKELGMKAVIFAVGETFALDTYKETGVKIHPHFGIKQMKEMEESGLIDVQSHTFAMHQSKDYEEGTAYENVLKTEKETEDEYIKRVNDDFLKWSNKVGKIPYALSYPHGQSDDLSEVLAVANGIKLTFGTEPKIDTLIKGLSQSGYSMGRFIITPDMPSEKVLELIR